MPKIVKVEEVAKSLLAIIIELMRFKLDSTSLNKFVSESKRIALHFCRKPITPHF